jgi:hypothetical protein
LYRERISSYPVKAENKVNTQYGVGYAFEDAPTAGLASAYFEITEVVHPRMFHWLYSRPQGTRWIFAWTTGTQTTDELSIEFPSSGYLTNISILNTQLLFGDNPGVFTLTTDDLDVSSEYDFSTLNSWRQRGRMNGIQWSALYQEGQDSSTTYKWFFRHFGNKTIKITDRAALNAYYITQNASSTYLIIQADFIPYKGSAWKQIYVNTGFTESESYNEGFVFAVDLDNASITVVSNITSGSGVMMAKVLQPNTTHVGPNSSVDSDVMEVTEFEQEGMYSKQSIQAMIPLSDAKGASTPLIPLGNIKAGQAFTWDFTGVTVMSGSIFFVITGKVARKYYSKSAKFCYSPDLFNYGTMQIRAGKLGT